MVFFFVQHIYFLRPQLREARWLSIYVNPNWTHQINNNLRQIQTYLVSSEAAQHFSAEAVCGSVRHLGKDLVVKATITSHKKLSPIATDDVKYKLRLSTNI